MNFEAYQKYIETQDGYGKSCVICGTPFMPQRKNQVTCLSPECKKARQQYCIKRRLENMSPYELELEKEKHRASNLKSRRKHYRAKRFGDGLSELERYVQKEEAFDKLIEEVGDHYGEYQAQKTLAMVEPIKLTLGDD